MKASNEVAAENAADNRRRNNDEARVERSNIFREAEQRLEDLRYEGCHAVKQERIDCLHDDEHYKCGVA